MIDLARLCAIAGKHGQAPPRELPIPWTGGGSHVYPLDDVVVKIPFDRTDAIQAVTTDAAIAPFARSCGATVPELIAFDDSRDIIVVPFAVFHRVGFAVSLQHVDPDPAPVRGTWEEVGRQIARVHGVRHGTGVPIELRTFRQSSDVDPRPWVDELRSRGVMREDDARWLHDLLDRLAPLALADVPLVLCHGDVNAANILVDERSCQFRALIDWAGAGWLDAAWDFAAVSLDVVPYLLAGHRSITPLPMDDTAEARICWCQAQTRLFGLLQVASPDIVREQLDRHLDQLRRFARTVGLL